MLVTSITLPVQFTPGYYTPAVDYTGAASANAVFGEVQVFDVNSQSPFTFIMPSFAAFFAASLVVEKQDPNTLAWSTLALGTDLTDYLLVYPFLGASRAIGQAVYGGIMLPIVANTTLRLAYQTLGGEWITGQSQNAAILLNELRNPGAVALEQVAAYTKSFPVVNQPWDKQDLTDMSAVQAQLSGMVDNLLTRANARNYSAEIAHITDQVNPHEVTKAGIGLGSVTDLPAASVITSQDTTNDSEYINTSQVNAMMKNWTAAASTAVQGLAQLNLGDQLGDDDDAAKALTAAGFSRIVSDPNSAIYKTYNKGQVTGAVSIFPFTYPISWQGATYNDQASFVAAVQVLVGVYPLEYDQNTGTFWFPANTVVPDLTITEL